MDLTYHTFSPDTTTETRALQALRKLVAAEGSMDLAWAQMILHRLDGNVVDLCIDNYFTAMQGDTCVSRLWCGWGRHADAAGNWGHFRTADAMQGKGIGRALINRWYKFQSQVTNGPAAFFCLVGKPYLVRLYGEYGFRLALKGTETGPMYCPQGKSPATFQEFCEDYYTASDTLSFLPGTAEYRHKIDCLLYYTYRERNAQFGLPSIGGYEDALMKLKHDPSAGTLERIVIPNGHTVGWAFTPRGGQREIQLHHHYSDTSLR